ncbi:MAG: YegP family protein [Pseudoxanthomonas sp.]
MAGKFVIGKRGNGQFQFNLKAGNGQVILTSQGYADKAGAKNGIESVRKNSQDDGRFERKTSSNGKPYFNLLAGNGQIVGSSELYESEASRENGIKSVRNHAPDAALVDETA